MCFAGTWAPALSSREAPSRSSPVGTHMAARPPTRGPTWVQSAVPRELPVGVGRLAPGTSLSRRLFCWPWKIEKSQLLPELAACSSAATRVPPTSATLDRLLSQHGHGLLHAFALVTHNPSAHQLSRQRREPDADADCSPSLAVPRSPAKDDLYRRVFFLPLSGAC